VPWHAELARTQALLAVSYYDASILADRDTSENRLNAAEHRFGIWAKEKHASFLRTLPKAAVAVGTSGCADRGDYSLKIEVGIDLVG
jgi:hypothetical protein